MTEDPSSRPSEDPPRSPDSEDFAPDDVTIDVSVETPAWREALRDPEALCEAAARGALSQAEARAALAALAGGSGRAELGVVLSDDATVRQLNRDYRGKDRPTNVLSFAAQEGDGPAPDGDGAPLLLGDTILAFETTAAEAEHEAKPLADHLRHLVVHGVLHLLGYDHEAPAEAEEMEALERRILDALGVADPYAPRTAEVPA